jgi:2-phospho-L-lactate guanylyltransferase
VSTADIERLLAAAADAPRAVVIGASHDGSGTNALLLRPPDLMPPAFGPPSLQRHIDAAKTTGASVTVLTGLELAHDIDTPEDLERLPTIATGTHTLEITSSFREVAAAD